MTNTWHRDELIAAQFMLGPDEYVNHIWRERMKANTTVEHASLNWPFKRADNVVQISSKRKK